MSVRYDSYRRVAGVSLRRGRLPRRPASAVTVVTYAAPAAQYESAIYDVSVNGKPAWTYPTSGGDHVAKFDSAFEAPVQVVVDLAADIVSGVTVGPASKAITAARTARQVTFTVDKPGRYPVVVDGDWSKPLIVVANPMLVNPPTVGTSNLTYIGPGVYTGDLVLPGSGDVFVHGGALCKSGIQVGAASPTGARITGGRIWGRGVVDSTLRTGASGPGRAFRTYNVDGLSVEGLTFVNQTHYGGAVYQSTAVNAAYCDMLSFRATAGDTPDGWDHIASSGCSFRNGFIHSYDDGLSMKWQKNGYSGDCRNNQVTDVVIVQGDGGNGIEVGWEVAPDTVGLIGDLLWQDIDIVRKTARADTNRRAAVSIHNTGPGPTRRITYRRVRVEYAQEGGLRVESFRTTDYPNSVGSGLISEITFESCTWPAGSPMSFLATGSTGSAADADAVPIGAVTMTSCQRGGAAVSLAMLARTNAPTVSVA